jgi:hypothetical protein
MGEIGRDSSAYRAQKPRHGRPMARFSLRLNQLPSPAFVNWRTDEHALGE